MACSSTWGTIPNALRTIRPIARATVALARKPGPKTPPVELKPSSWRIGPLTTISGAGPLVLCQPPPVAERSRISASHTASTTGKCSGRQPAMAALMAASSTVHSRFRWSMRPMTSRRSRAVRARNRSSSGSDTGTTGKPSVQPCS